MPRRASSPAPPKAETLILTTTNGTRAILAAVARCDVVLLGSLLNLSALAAAARADGGDVAIVCSGFKGTFALDDAYCAGRIVAELDGERTDAAIAAEVLARNWPEPLDGPERAHLRASRPRGGHRVLCAGRSARDGAALLPHGRSRGRDRRVKLVGELPSRLIEHFGSEGFRHTRVARGDVQVSVAQLDGVIGGHEAASQQLLVVLAGRVVASTRDESVELVWERPSSGGKASGTRRVL